MQVCQNCVRLIRCHEGVNGSFFGTFGPNNAFCDQVTLSAITKQEAIAPENIQLMQNTKSRDTKRGDDHDGRSQLDQTMLQVYTGLDGVYTRYPNEARAHCEYWDGWSLDCLG